MADVAWARLDVTSLDQVWLEDIDPMCGLAWVRLTLYLKASAPSQKRPGRAPAMSARTCERLWRVPAELVEEMLEAALNAGVLRVDDGHWQAADTSPFVSQRTNEYRATPAREEMAASTPDPIGFADFAEKQRKTRRTRKTPHNDAKSAKPETLSRDRTGQDKDTVANATGDEAPDAVGGESLKEPVMDPYARCERVITAVRAEAGWSPPEPPDVRRELNAKGPTLSRLLAWVEAHPDQERLKKVAAVAAREYPALSSLPTVPEQAAAGMFLRALGGWRTDGQPSWSWVFANRDPLVAPGHLDVAKLPKSQGIEGLMDQADDLATRMQAEIDAMRGGSA